MQIDSFKKNSTLIINGVRALKAPDFFKKYGLEESISILDEWDDMKPFWCLSRGFVYVTNTCDMNSVHLPDLKRIVESHELVEKFGGLELCKNKISTRNLLGPNATHFAIHPEEPHLIQLYTRNSVKHVPNYSFKELIKAMKDVESCK